MIFGKDSKRGIWLAYLLAFCCGVFLGTSQPMASEICTDRNEFISVMTSCAVDKKQIPLYQEKDRTQQKIIKEKDKIISKQSEEITALYAHKEAADSLRETLLQDREEHLKEREEQRRENAELREQLANRPRDWVFAAEVATTVLAARWGGGHLWRIGKKLMGR